MTYLLEKLQIHAINLLERIQLEDGRFAGRLIENRRQTGSIFPTIYCSTQLDNVQNNKDLGKLLDKAKSFISSQMSSGLSWNYWGNPGSPESSVSPHPDDLDDTSLALRTLVIGGKLCDAAISSYSNSLRMTDCGYGGPFNTWIIGWVKSDCCWRDIDVVVNANILHCLNALDIDMPGITTFIGSHIEHGCYPSRYYDHPIVVLYAIARALEGRSSDAPLIRRLRNEIICRCRTVLDGDHHNVLLSAHALSSLIRVGGDNIMAKRLFDLIIQCEDKWNHEYPLYIEKISGNKKYHAGSAAITLSSIIEALDLYARTYDVKPPVRHTSTPDHTNPALNKAFRRFSSDDGCLSSTSLKELIIISMKSMLQMENIRSIIELPIKAYDSLIDAATISGSNLELCLSIGLAGWTAWSIADNIRDRSEKKKSDLAAFTILHSIVHDLIGATALMSDQRNYIGEVLDIMEEANLDESKMGLWKKTGYKSIGASIPILIMIMKAGGSKADLYSCKNYFYHFILARQISDDACDWRDDMTNGDETLITKWLGQSAGSGCGHSDRPADPDFETIFRKEVAARAALEIRKHARIAIQHAKAIKSFEETLFLERLVLCYEDITQPIIQRDASRQLFERQFWNRAHTPNL